jgi:hypothetical protein
MPITFNVVETPEGFFAYKSTKPNELYKVNSSIGYGYAMKSDDVRFHDRRNIARITPTIIYGQEYLYNPQTDRFIKNNATNDRATAIRADYHREMEALAGVQQIRKEQPTQATQQREIIVSQKPIQPDPEVVQVNQENNYSQFIRTDYQVENATPGSFINTIFNEMKRKNAFAAKVTFNVADTVYHRVITGNTYQQLKNSLLAIVHGDNKPGSDALTDGAQLDMNSFSLLIRRVLRGGHFPSGVSTVTAPEHRHLMLWSPKPSGLNNCLFDVVKCIARDFRKLDGKREMTKGEVCNKLLRKLTNTEENTPIATDIDIFNKLSIHFGYDIAVVLDIAVLPDAQRKYRDDQNKVTSRNICETRDVSIITELKTCNFPENVRVIDICLIDGHYCGIKTDLSPGTLERENVCPITGDLYDSKYGFTKDWKINKEKTTYIYDRLSEQGREYLPNRNIKLNGAAQAKITEKTPMTMRYIFYDFETVYEKSGELKPYSLGFAEFSQSEMDEAATDSKFFEDKIERVRISKMKPIGCVCNSLLDLLEQAPANVKYLLVSFNGSAFDHLLLATAAANREMLIDVFATNNILRSISIGNRARTKHNAHTTLDIAKILTGSLDEACKDFNTIPKKVEGFNHWEVQQAYQQEGEEKFISFDGWLGKNQKQHDKYLVCDVLSLASLTVKCHKAIKDITEIDLYTSKVQTAAGIAYTYLKKICAIPNAVDDIETDEFIRRSIIGGRTQVYRPSQSFEKDEESDKYKEKEIEKGCFINGKLQMIDFASLYPTVMSLPAKYRENKIFDDNVIFCEYPDTNKYIKTTEYVQGKIGFYECKIKSQPLYKVIPKRDEEGSLDWNYSGEFIAVITHFDIELIRMNGGEVDIIHGIYFESASKTLMTDFIEPLAMLKDQQDQFKEEKHEDFNPALRAFYKLLQNASSGKFLQANYDDECVLATGLSQFYAAEKGLIPESINYVTINRNSTLITGKRADRNYNPKYAKPSFIGCLIYSYARGLLYRCCIQSFLEKSSQKDDSLGPLYSDTDSMLFTESDCDKVFKLFPYLDCRNRKKERGDLECELENHKNANAYLIEKKDYVIIVDNMNEDVEIRAKFIDDNSKIRIKGINRKRDKIITDIQAELIQQKIENKLGIKYNLFEYEEGKGLDAMYECGEIYNNLPKMNMESIEQVARFRINKKDSEDEKNKYVKKSYFMCSQLRKRFSEFGFYIDQVFMVKSL